MMDYQFRPDDLLQFTHFPSIIIAKFDGEGRLISINDEVTRILGWQSSEILGRLHSEFLISDNCKLYPMTAGFFSCRMRHRNGSWVWLNWAVREANGNFFVLARENSREHEQTETARVTAGRLSLALKISEVGIFEWWPSTNYVWQDEIIERIFGYSKGQMPNHLDAYRPHYDPVDARIINQEVELAISALRLYSYEHRIWQKGGEQRWVKCWIQPVAEPDGSVRVIGSMMDITGQKELVEDQKFLAQVAEILASSLEHVKNIESVLTLLVQYMCDVAYVDYINEEASNMERISVRKDPLTRKIEISRKNFRFEPITSPHPIVAKMLTGDVVHVQDAERFMGELGQLVSRSFIDNIRTQNAKSMLTTTLKRKDHLIGAVVLCLDRLTPREFTERDARILRDVSSRISMAMENSKLYSSSQEAVRARDEFLSIASHELKTPLQSLTLQNDMLTRRLDRNPDDKDNIPLVRKFLEGDRRQLSRITRLIEDMLDITRILNSSLRIEKEHFDFAGLLKLVLDQMRPAFENERVELTVETEAPIPIHADSYRLEQVITNILSNALKYGNQMPVEVRASTENNSLEFSVTDHGPGIPEKDLKRIFQRFERGQVKPGANGLGLGLYISQKIVDAHGGNIRVDSEPGKGSTFTVILPLSK